MTSTSSRNLRIRALSLAFALVCSGPAAAAWNPAATGQPGPSAPPSAAQPTPSSQPITSGTLAAEANPNTDGYDKKFKQSWKPNSSSFATPTVANASFGGTAPTYISGYCVRVYGYAYSTGNDPGVGCIASMSSVDNLYQYTAYQFDQVMKWLEKIYDYLSNGDGETGTGVIGTINKNHDLDRIALQEQMALDHSRAQELAMKTAQATAVAGKIQSYRACDDIPATASAQGAGGGGVSRGSGASPAKGATEKKIADSLAGGKNSEIAHSAQIFSEHAKAYCSSQDVTYSDGKPRNAFQCSAPSAMPDADARAQSVFAPAHDYSNAAIAEKVNLTYRITGDIKTDQKMAADAAIKNIVSAFSPPALPKNVESSDAGKMYLSKTKVFNARVSAAVHALASMADRRTPVSGEFSGAGGSADNGWWAALSGTDWKTQYESVFGTGSAPKQLSEADSLRFEVFRRYYSKPGDKAGWYGKEVTAADDEERSRESIRMQSAQMLILYNIHQRMEENNMIQAAILAHLINPVTKEELDQTALTTLRKQ